MRRLIGLIAGVTTVLLLAACVPVQPAAPPALADTTVTLNFGTDGSASGSDGCNRYNTSYTTDGDTIQFSPNAAATMMACPEPIMTQSTAYYTALTSAATFAIQDGVLTLADSTGAPVAVFAAQNTGLAGTNWNAIAYNNGNQAVVGLVEGSTITADFSADGVVSGNSGCNSYSGGFTTDGEGNIQIGPLASTMMACADPGVSEQEAAYLAALGTAATYQIDGDTMQLRTADDALAAQFQRALPVAETEAPVATGDVVSSDATVSGTVSYLVRSALPPDALIEVTIRNAQLADAPPEMTLLAMTAFTSGGQQVPIPYTVVYSPADVEEGALYSIGARITAANGQLLFVSTQATPVITKGNPTENVEIIVDPVN
ncbi:MAG: META domain-containing protein [Anaerolineales bacterium]|nr:META domain-containing protein [Anaerolineales bacterium]